METEEINNTLASTTQLVDSSRQFVDTVNQLLSAHANMEYGLKQLDVQFEAYSRMLQTGLAKHNLNVDTIRGTLDNYNNQITKLIDHALTMDDNDQQKWYYFDKASEIQDKINDLIFKLLAN